LETPRSIHDQLAQHAETHAARWQAHVERLEAQFGRLPDVDAVLFLMGIQSVGRGYEPDLPKERKQSLIMEGSYLAFETFGLYQRMGLEKNGFWLWEKRFDLPKLSIDDQERLLQLGILNYFDQSKS